MLACARELDVQYKTAFVLAHKLREAVGIEHEGAAAALVVRDGLLRIDGAYFGGHVRPENLVADQRIDRRSLPGDQSGKRQVVVVMRERDGRTLPQVLLGRGGRRAGDPASGSPPGHRGSCR